MPASTARPLDRAARSLTHPLALAVAAALLLNALVFQRLWPAWWTGKLGDVAWLVLLPLLVEPLLRAAGLRGRAPAAALALTGLGFALVKTVPGANALVVGTLARLGYGLKLALDPTDLLALPGLALAACVWRPSDRPRRPAPRPLRLAGLGLALLALVADSAGAINQGVTCVGQAGTDLIAVTETTPSGYFAGFTVQTLRSTDGGLTWTVDAQTDVAPNKLDDGPRSQCAQVNWPLSDPADPQRFYTWVDGQGLYVTTDGGQTLTLDLARGSLPVHLTSAVIDTATGNLVLAAAREGVAVRAPGGVWQTLAVTLGPGR